MKATVFIYPFIILQFIGLVLSIFWRSRLRRAWIPASIGFIMLLIGNLGSVLFFVYLFWIYDPAIQGPRSLDIVGITQSSIQGGLGTFGYLLLMIALFIRREPNAS